MNKHLRAGNGNPPPKTKPIPDKSETPPAEPADTDDTTEA